MLELSKWPSDAYLPLMTNVPVNTLPCFHQWFNTMAPTDLWFLEPPAVMVSWSVGKQFTDQSSSITKRPDSWMAFCWDCYRHSAEELLSCRDICGPWLPLSFCTVSGFILVIFVSTHCLSLQSKKIGKSWEELFFSLTCWDFFPSGWCFLGPHRSTQVFIDPTSDLLLMVLLERKRGLLMFDF